MRSPLAMVTVLLALVGLSACGDGARTGARTATPPGGAKPPSARAAPAGTAKRRYLAHFHNDCRAAGRLGKATGDVVGSLSAQIAHGNLTAVTELNVFLQRLAATYQAGLRGTRALGSPPEPDSRDGRAYLNDTQRMIAAIRAMGAAVGRLDARGLHSAAAGLHSASAAAGSAAKRYGFPSCGRGSSGALPPPGAPAGAPV